MLPFLKRAADALAGAVRHRVTMTGIVVDSLRARDDPNQAKIDELKYLVESYEEKPNLRTADALARAVCRLIKGKILSERGAPGDQYLAYVAERMSSEYDPIGTFEKIAMRRERVRRR